MQNKFVRSALRKSGKKVKSDFQAIVKAEAFETGAYLRSTTVRATKRSRSKVGVSLQVDTLKFAREYLAGYGDFPTSMAGESRPFFVPAAIEFGYRLRNGNHVGAIKPQRRALYGNKRNVRSNFIRDLQAIIKEAKTKRR